MEKAFIAESDGKVTSEEMENIFLWVDVGEELHIEDFKPKEET